MPNLVQIAPASIVQARGAACLDGSPPGVYFMPSTGDGVNKWRVHFHGGGICSSVSDCTTRSQVRMRGGFVGGFPRAPC